MIYKFVVFSEEVDAFRREILIDASSTFLDLHDAILSSVGYANDQITSFFICDDEWERGAEITQVEMNTSSDEDNFVMAETKLEEFIEDEGQKMMFVFDMMNDRSFLLELRDIQTGKDLAKFECVLSKGKAPKQILDGLFMDDVALAKKNGLDDPFLDDNFGDCGGFDVDELGDGYSINDENEF